jgi:uncharacterized protein YeaO (DUF488 family)
VESKIPLNKSVMHRLEPYARGALLWHTGTTNGSNGDGRRSDPTSDESAGRLSLERRNMTNAYHKVAIKRAYDPPARGDGVRILVDRLWPRGLRKDAARFDQWRKDLSPSTELRQFYGHRPERFAEFNKRYRAELRKNEAAAAVSELIDLCRRRPVTLLTASRDLSHSEAAVLAAYLQRIISRQVRSPRSSSKAVKDR